MENDVDVIDISAYQHSGDVEIGKWAIDKEDEDAVVLVLEIEDTPANEKVVFETPEGERDLTVANFKNNRKYDSSDNIVYTIYKNKIEKACGENATVSDVIEQYNQEQIEERFVFIYPFGRLNPL